MASALAYRPSTSGGASNVPTRRPSAVSNNSFRSKHSVTTPTSDEQAPFIPSRGPETARAALFNFNRPRLGSNHNSLSRKRKRMVRPQYPAGTEEKHVEYILVASFDIDQGSIMEHQYPAAIGGDEHMLAELMLPDGAHARSQDWTMFFLHKEQSEEEAGELENRRQRRALAKEDKKDTKDADDDESHDHDDVESVGSAEDDDLHSVEGPPLVYVLNLVVTKQDNTVRRGAVCKAMAICTRHPFLHIYKPLLLLAIEEYFRSPVPETLAILYNAVNSMDLSALPRLSPMERSILQASDTRELFMEKFEALIQQNMAAKGEKAPELAGGESPTMARQRWGLPRDTHEFESVIPYNGIPIPVKIPTGLIMETVGDFSLIQLIQTFSNPHSSSPQPFQTLHPHLTTSGPLTHPIIVLLNALLTQKRVVFIGHGLPSSKVAEAVLAACALASGGLLRGFVRHAFPYTDLTKIDDLLQVPGFIAGVTNPTFSLHAEWWDLLCDLNTGRMKISPNIEAAPPTEGVAYFQAGGPGYDKHAGTLTGLGEPTGDNAFMSSVMQSVNERRGESSIRAKFRLWILKFTRQAAAFEELVYGASALIVSSPTLPSQSSPMMPLTGTSAAFAQFPDPVDPAVKGYGYVWPSAAEKQKELAANATRIEGWMKTRSYYNYIQDLAVTYSYRAVRDLDLQHLHDKLVKLRLGADTAGAIYRAICDNVHSEAQINQLLVVVVNTGSVAGGSGSALSGLSAAGGGGLFHLALGLFHPKLDVREKMAELLSRIREHDAGRHFWAKLGGFEKAAWERIETARREKE